MTPPNISKRRQLFTGIMLALALLGGLVRWQAPQPSLARDLGTMLLVLWLPIVGNVIAWLVQRARTPRQLPAGVAFSDTFQPDARIELTLLPADTPSQSRPIRAGDFVGALAVGSEAFTTRLSVPPGGEPVPEQPILLDAQFLRPELALAQLRPSTRFVLLAGRTTLGTGYVVSSGASGAPGGESLAVQDRSAQP